MIGHIYINGFQIALEDFYLTKDALSFQALNHGQKLFDWFLGQETVALRFLNINQKAMIVACETVCSYSDAGLDMKYDVRITLLGKV